MNKTYINFIILIILISIALTFVFTVWMGKKQSFSFNIKQCREREIKGILMALNPLVSSLKHNWQLENSWEKKANICSFLQHTLLQQENLNRMMNNKIDSDTNTSSSMAIYEVFVPCNKRSRSTISKERPALFSGAAHAQFTVLVCWLHRTYAVEKFCLAAVLVTVSCM